MKSDNSDVLKKKILVVDDEESILDAVKLILEDEGYEVETVSKGEKAYSVVKDFLPKVILLDVLMSGADGRHICKKLKTTDGTKHIKIVMISAHPSAKDTAVEAGADYFLAKPFETVDLLDTVERFSV